MTGKIGRTIALVATVAFAGSLPAAATEINLTKAYGHVTIPVASIPIDKTAVASAWCRSKGHGHAVDTILLGVRKIPGQPGGKATYRLINCLMVPLDG